MQRSKRQFLILIALSAILGGCDSTSEAKQPQPSDKPAESEGEKAAPEAPSAEPTAAPDDTTGQAAAKHGLADPKAEAELGEPAPDFTLPEVDGAEVNLAALRGKTVVLEWFNPDCPFIKYAHGRGPLKDMAKRMQSSSLVWLSINSGAEGKQGHGLQRNRQAKQEYGMDNAVLLDPSGQVGHAYGAEKTPHMFVIDPAGTLVYRGALDNAPIGTVEDSRPRYPDSVEGTVVNYVEGALEDMRAQKPLRLPETPAYGCSVKYQ